MTLLIFTSIPAHQVVGPAYQVVLLNILSINAGPHCRTSYEDGPQNELYERLSKLIEQRKEAEKEEARLSACEMQDHSGASAAVLQVPKIAHTASVHPSSPLPNMNLEEESMWPGLAAAAKPQQPPLIKKSRPPPAVPQPEAPFVDYPSCSADWMNNNGNFPRNFTSSAHIASGSETASPPPSSSSHPEAGNSTVIVSYHGAANEFIIPNTEPLSASGKCLINLDNTIAAAAAQTGSLVSVESAALLNAMKEAIQSGKITVQGAVSTLMQHLETTSKNKAMNNYSVRGNTDFGMFSEQDAARFNNLSGGSSHFDTTGNLFAGLSLYSDNKQTISTTHTFISIPPGLSIGHEQGFGIKLDFGNNTSSTDSIGVVGGVQRSPPPGF
jgi:hypothetical protein